MNDLINTTWTKQDIKPVWSDVGTKLAPGMSSEDILRAASLDWHVIKAQPYYEYDGILKPTSKQALIFDSKGKYEDYDGQELSVVSDGWEEVQNHEALDFVMKFIEHGFMTMDSAGFVKSGRLVWFVAKLNDSFEVFGGDRIDSYLLFTNPHIYGTTLDIRLIPNRLECGNQLTLEISKKGDLNVKLNHRRKFDPDFVRVALMEARSKILNYKRTAEFLGSRKASPEMVQRYFMDVFPASSKDKVSRQAKTAMAILTTQPGNEYAKGTWWQPYNAVTWITDHLGNIDPEQRLTSLWYGLQRTRKIAALEAARQYAEDA